jgi:hypothetical protein
MATCLERRSPDGRFRNRKADALAEMVAGRL